MENQVIYELIRNITRIFAAIMLIKYSVFLFVAPLHSIKEALRRIKVFRSRGNKKYNPIVSVLVPAWNEEVGIISTVESILDNDYQNIDLIVINDGSTDGTDRLIREYIKVKKLSSGKRVTYFSKENGGKGAALNYGLERSSGEIVLTVDADSIADKNMIKNLVNYFADNDIDAVVGNVKVAGSLTFLNLLQRLEYLFGFYHKRAHSFLGAEYIYGGACAAFRKSTVFDSIGKFDEDSITEDIEMSLRTRYHGLSAVFAVDALCYTEGANTVTGLIKQRFRWKKGRLEAFLKYKRMFLTTNMKHNRWLGWFILPFAVLAELHLLFEPIGLALLVSYSLITGEFSSILLGALFIGIMYLVVGLFTERAKNWWIIPMMPFTWAIFYFLIWIEYLALMKTILTTLRVEAVAWQKWQRKGIDLGRIQEQKYGEAKR